MTEQEYKELLAIRDGAPEDHNHYAVLNDGKSTYLLDTMCEVHSLADIEKLISLKDELDSLKIKAVNNE